MDFRKQAQLDVPRQTVWRVLEDFQGVARCLPSCREVAAGAEADTYVLHVEDRVGPFRVGIRLDSRVEERLPAQRLVVSAKGLEHRTNTAVTLRIVIELQENSDGQGSLLDLNVHVDMLGTLGTLAMPVLTRKADDIFKEFMARLESRVREGADG